MNGADALIFAGGIGENASAVRTRICDGLQWMGIEIDAARNAEMVNGKEGRIDREGSRVEVWVIPTDEELLIARDTVRVVLGIEHPS
jgi:acetate kinase